VTFSEVLVSALILSVAMVPIVQAMGRVHFFSARLEKVSRSQVLAQNQLEELRARAVSDFSGTWSVSNQALGGGYLGTISAEPDALLRTVSVSVGYDENGNGVLEGDEVLAVLRSRIARLQ
jgi:Tfp pilus assembly protein PilV